MASSWETYLLENGATLAYDNTCHFADVRKEQQVAVSHDTLIDLSSHGCLAISGHDAEKFLQGQLTCHMAEVTAQQSRLGAHCDPKGRIQMTFRILQHQNSYYLYLPANILPHALMSLQKYARFFKVTLQDISKAWVWIGCSGPEIIAKLMPFFAELPPNIDAISHTPHLVIVRVPSIFPRFLLGGPLPEIVDIWQSLRTHITAVSAQAWQLLDILQGIPTIYEETRGEFTPHQISYQLINGISFHKGCYTGQEIIARMQYLGKLKQALYRVHGNGDPPIRNTPLWSQGIEVGTILDAVPAPDQGYQALAVLQNNIVSQAIYTSENPMERVEIAL